MPPRRPRPNSAAADVAGAKARAPQKARARERVQAEDASNPPAAPAKKTRAKRKRAAAADDGEDAEGAALESDALDESADDAPRKPRAKRGASATASKAKRKLKPVADQSDALDSDALDDDDDGAAPVPRRKSAARRRKKARVDAHAVDSELGLAEGQEAAGRIVQAPTTGRVPPGQLSRNTLNFLGRLADPACNNREWLKLHDPVFRHAQGEFKVFVEALTNVLVRTDAQLPLLPPKDVIHRIHRDLRCSNDKTPYKPVFGASFSRSGRNGIFAGYHILIRPGDSLITAGVWHPDKNEMQTIRSHIQRDPSRLKAILAAPAFTSHFGAPHPSATGAKQSIFGRDDELKNAPKNVARDHPEIALLRLRTFAVAHRFTDEEVLEEAFAERVGEVAEVMRPFVHCLNDMMMIPPDDEDDEGDGEDDDATAEERGDA